MGLSPMMLQLKDALAKQGVRSGGSQDEVLDAAIQWMRRAVPKTPDVNPKTPDVNPKTPDVNPKTPDTPKPRASRKKKTP